MPLRPGWDLVSRSAMEPVPEVPGPEDVPVDLSESDMPAAENESGNENKDENVLPRVPNGKRQRQGSGETKPPVVEKVELTVEERPDDLKENEKDVRNY